METIFEQHCYGGVPRFYRHRSACCDGPMRFAAYQPPQAKQMKRPVWNCLAGLTCNEQIAAIKAGAQRLAAELGLILVMPDTRPRHSEIDGATDSWNFGEGASFYVDATMSPWSERFCRHSYLADELPALIVVHFPVAIPRSGLLGHSMGGHGALTIALKYPARYRSVSASAAIEALRQVSWGRTTLSRYLGNDQTTWADNDVCELKRRQTFPGTILIDQSEPDQFLEAQLKPELLDQACAEVGQALLLRRHSGYDHSYWFISSFIGDHSQHHAKAEGAL